MEGGYGEVTIPRILNMKRSGEKIAMIKAYDHPTALPPTRLALISFL